MKSFLKDDRGSFTIEASFVFPSLLIFTLLGVFFCIVVFQIGTANYVAQKAAAQTAFVWNNSHKDIVTGEFGKQYYSGLDTGGDGLYWRLTDNNILSIFNIAGSFSIAGDKKDLTDIKTGKAKDKGAITVEVSYNNKLIYSEVKATAESSLYIPSFVVSVLGSDTVQATSTHVVTDTPELVRTFNFTKYIWSEFGLGGKATDASESIKKFFGG